MSKICIKCNINQASKKYCKSCAILFNNEREKMRAKKRIIIKMNGANKLRRILLSIKLYKCNNCGYNKCKRALCFHHLNENTKIFTLDSSNLMKKNMNDILIEFDKCIILCQNCHSDLHQLERESNLKETYIIKRTKRITRKFNLVNKFGCKCIACQKQFTINNIQSASFHHIDKSKKSFSLDTLCFTDKSEKIIEQEAQKCQLLCMNCHMEIEDSLY